MRIISVDSAYNMDGWFIYFVVSILDSGFMYDSFDTFAVLSEQIAVLEVRKLRKGSFDTCEK